MDALLVDLDQEHPGFRDLHYRKRRDAIARIAIEHEAGEVKTTPKRNKKEKSIA